MNRRRPWALLAVAAVTLSACGSGDDPVPAADAVDAADAVAPAEPSTAAADDVRSDPGARPDLPIANADTPFPAVTVRDIVNDRWVQFADVLPAERPVLIWFWAPF